MKLTEAEMIAMLKKQYINIMSCGPDVIAEYYAWHTSLPQDERDQISEYLKENDNENALWRK